MTYIYCKEVISKGSCNKEGMLDKLDIFFLAERITDEQYKELVAMLQG